MQVHEKRYMKCAGVAGLRERATGLNGANRTILDEPARSGRGKSRRFGALQERKFRERRVAGQCSATRQRALQGALVEGGIGEKRNK